MLPTYNVATQGSSNNLRTEQHLKLLSSSSPEQRDKSIHLRLSVLLVSHQATPELHTDTHRAHSRKSIKLQATPGLQRERPIGFPVTIGRGSLSHPQQVACLEWCMDARGWEASPWVPLAAYASCVCMHKWHIILLAVWCSLYPVLRWQDNNSSNL